MRLAMPLAVNAAPRQRQLRGRGAAAWREAPTTHARALTPCASQHLALARTSPEVRSAHAGSPAQEAHAVSAALDASAERWAPG